MAEGQKPFPTPRQQIGNYFRSSIQHRLADIRARTVHRKMASLERPVEEVSPSLHNIHQVARNENLFFTTLDESTNGRLMGPIVVGMSVLMPDEIERSEYMRDSERRRLANTLLSYQIIFNEELDFTGGREVIPPNTQQKEAILEKVIRPRANERLEALQLAMRFAKPEVQNVITNFITETRTVEETIKERYRNGQPFGIADARDYKSLVNAIYMNAIIATTLGRDVLADKLQMPQEEGLSEFERIQRKYEWLTKAGNVEYDNNIERSTLIMFNLAMAGQVDDDWLGQQVDARLGVPSFATGALESTGDNRQEAEELLHNIREEYKATARKLGFARVGAWLAVWGQEKGQQRMHGYLKRARQRNGERVARGLEPKYVDDFPATPLFGRIRLAIRDAAFANLEI